MILKQIPFHPFFFGIFPILALYESSIRFTKISELFFPILLISVISTVGIIFSFKFTKNHYTSYVCFSILLLTFLLYGYLYYFIEDLDFFNTDLGKHRYLIPIILGLMITLVYKLKKIKSNFITVNYFLNIFSIMIVFIMIFNMTSFFISSENSELFDNSRIFNDSTTKSLNNVYFIILDGYPGDVSLKKFHNYDNSKFISSMQSIGFTNHQQSYSNYAHTFLSIPSMLNMKYLNYLGETLSESRDQNIPLMMGSDNEVMNLAKSLGYLTVSFDSGWSFTRDVKSADLLLCGDNQFLNSEFFITLVKNSILNPIYVKLYEGNIVDLKLCVFEQLPKINTRTAQPIFVFAHIFMPHPPYLFDSKGNIIDIKTLEPNLENSANLEKNYFLGQMEFVNLKIQETTLEIIKNDPTSFIIILSDHGTNFLIGGNSENWKNPTNDMIEERMDILLMTYTPENYNYIFSNIHTPVNIFRVFYNEVFSLDYPYLQDKIYFGKDGYYNLINTTKLLLN